MGIVWVHFQWVALEILKRIGITAVIWLFLMGFILLHRFMSLLCKKAYKKYAFHFKVKRLPTFRHEDRSRAVDASMCAVCLENYRDGELCKLLPACGHVFHITCIDTWLKKQLTCPLCRTSITKLRDNYDLLV